MSVFIPPQVAYDLKLLAPNLSAKLMLEGFSQYLSHKRASWTADNDGLRKALRGYAFQLAEDHEAGPFADKVFMEGWLIHWFELNWITIEDAQKYFETNSVQLKNGNFSRIGLLTFTKRLLDPHHGDLLPLAARALWLELLERSEGDLIMAYAELEFLVAETSSRSERVESGDQ